MHATLPRMIPDTARPKPSCWCGNTGLTDFSDTYAACCECGTLVSLCGLRPEEVEVRDDDHDFYGRPYWISRPRDELGFPDIYERVRLDLPERCLYWLRTLLGYRLPPARVLELGSGHGAFVGLMRAAGYDATGLELSPWVVDFARSAFGIPVLLGPIEAQTVPERSLDAIVLNDVLEHLVDPLASTRRCAELLQPTGFLQAQTPCYPEGQSHRQLVERNHPFLAMLQEREHLYLFSRRAVRRLFATVGLSIVRFEPALFPYDMVVIASAQPLALTDARLRDEALLASPPARFVRALVDLDDRARELSRRMNQIESDRTQRIAMIEHLNRHIEQTSRDDEARQGVIRDQRATIDTIGQQIAQLSRDYEARGQVIHDQQAALDEIERDRKDRLATIDQLNRHIERTSADYEARGRVIRDQQAALDDIERDRRERLAMIERLNRHIEQTSADYEARGRVIRDQQALLKDAERERQTLQAAVEHLHRTLERTNADAEIREQVLSQQQTALEAQRREIARLTAEHAESEKRLARLASESEARERVISGQQATIENLTQQHEQTHLALSGLMQSRLVSVLRTLRLL